jgi:outer membrane lipoprotein LolB
MLRSASRLALVAGLTGLLSACTTTGRLSSSTVAEYRDAIDLAGRISVNYERDGTPESLSGKFTWVQTPQEVNVALANPLGQTVATIKVTPTAATLTQSDRAPKVAADIDSLTTQALGWPLPVSGLRDWLQGYATDVDGKRFAASPAANQVTTKDGWKVTFVNWQDENAAKPVPKRIDAERAATLDMGALTIRIVVDTRS